MCLKPLSNWRLALPFSQIVTLCQFQYLLLSSSTLLITEFPSFPPFLPNVNTCVLLLSFFQQFHEPKHLHLNTATRWENSGDDGTRKGIEQLWSQFLDSLVFVELLWIGLVHHRANHRLYLFLSYCQTGCFRKVLRKSCIEHFWCWWSKNCCRKIFHEEMQWCLASFEEVGCNVYKLGKTSRVQKFADW